MIVTIEGTDGSGKATQSKLLYETLVGKGYNCKIVSFPNYESKSSELVKMYLGGAFGNSADCLDAYQASSLYAVDRLATMQLIDCSNYDYIILDRYSTSNMIHQACKIMDPFERDKCLAWLNDFEFDKLKLPKPDIVLFLDLPIDLSLQLAHSRKNLKNGQNKDILEEDSAYMRHAYDCAKYVAKKYNWQTINCSENGKILTIEEIHKKILKAINI